MSLCLSCSDQPVPRPLPDELGGAAHASLKHREPHQLKELPCLLWLQREDLLQFLLVRRWPHCESVPLLVCLQPEVIHQEAVERQEPLGEH